MSKLFGKIISKKVKAVILSCCLGLAVAAGAITTAVVLTNNNGIPAGDVADVVATTPTTEVTIGASDNKSQKWSEAVTTSKQYAVPVNVRLTANWTATLNAKGSYKIFGDTSLAGFDVRGALEVPSGATINLNLGGYTLDRALVDEVNLTSNRAVIAGSVIINRGTLNISNGTVQHGYSSTHGGGIYSYGNLTLGSNLTIRANYADLNGGAVYCERSLTVNGPTTISENYANRMNNNFTGKGGAIYAKGGIVSINNLTAENNQAAMGGALAFEGEGTTFTITNSTFKSNTAIANNQTDFTPDGGAIWVGADTNRAGAVNKIESTNIGVSGAGNVAHRHGGGIAYFGKNTLNIVKSNISYNTANQALYGRLGKGGAIYKDAEGTLNIEGANGTGAATNYIRDNSALSGGALATISGTTNITGRMYFTANRYGGNFSGSTTSAVGYGGHIYVSGGTLNIGTPIGEGETHPANDYQPYIGQNGFVANATHSTYGGALYCNELSTTNLYGGTIDQCKSLVGSSGAVYCNEDYYYAYINMYDFTITRCSSVSYNDQGTKLASSNSYSAIVYGTWNIYGGAITKCGNSSVTGISNGRQYSASVMYLNSNSNIYKCEISGNNDGTLLYGGKVGVKEDTSDGASGKVQIKNNTMTDYIVDGYSSYLYNCTLSGNTCPSLASSRPKIYSGCKLINNSISKLGAGSYYGINLKSWLAGSGISIANTFTNNFTLEDCVVSDITTEGGGLFYNNDKSYVSIELRNTTISNNTFGGGYIFYCADIDTTNASENLSLLGGVSIINNTIPAPSGGITATDSRDYWCYYVRGGNNVVSGNTKNCYFSSTSYGGIYVDGALGYGNNLQVSQTRSNSTSGSYSYYAKIDGSTVIDPDSWIHFENTSYHAYQSYNDYLYFGTSAPVKPAEDTCVPVYDRKYDYSCITHLDPADGYIKFDGQYLYAYDPTRSEITSFTYQPYNVSGTSLGAKQTYTFTGFIDGFITVASSTGIYSTNGTPVYPIYFYLPGEYTITFKIKDSVNNTFVNNDAKTYTTTARRITKGSVAYYPTGSSYTYATYYSSTYEPGAKLGSITSYYGYTNHEKKVQYYKTATDRTNGTNEISANSYFDAQTYYLKITPNYTNYQIYCNKDGKGWTAVNGEFAYYWWAPSNPWQPELRIQQRTFTSYTKFIMPENTLIPHGGSATPNSTIEVWENNSGKLFTRKLVLGVDYTLSYSNNTAAGMGTVTITPIKNFTGAVTQQFKISVSSTPKITGTPTVSTVEKEYDATDKYPGTIGIGTLTLSDPTTNKVFEEEALSISSISAKFSQSAIGNCQLVLTLTFTGNYQSEYNTAEITYSTIGGQQVRIKARDISGINLGYTSYDDNQMSSRSSFWRPDVRYNNGAQMIYLQEGVDFDYVYKRNGVVTTDYRSKGYVDVYAVGKGTYTGTAHGRYGIGADYVHNGYLTCYYEDEYSWEGGVYQLIDADEPLTNASYHRLDFDVRFRKWNEELIGKPEPQGIIVYFNPDVYYDDFQEEYSSSEEAVMDYIALPGSKTHLEFTEPGNYSINWVAYVYGDDGVFYSGYDEFTLYFEREEVSLPVINKTQTFTYDGTNKTFVTSYDSSKINLSVKYTAPNGTVTEYAAGNTAYADAGKYELTFKTKPLYQFERSAMVTNSLTTYKQNYEITDIELNTISFSGGNSFTYNGSAQGPTVAASLTKSTNNKVISGQTVYIGYLYTGTDSAGNAYSSKTGPTNAGSYKLTLTGLYTNSACTTVNNNYRFNASQTKEYAFTIGKANLTVNTPAITSGQTIYVGWNLSQVTLNQNIKVTYGTNLNLAGSWQWVEPDTKIMKPANAVLDANHTFTATYAVKFVISESEDNFNITSTTFNKTITITVNSLYVHVVEHITDEYGNLVGGGNTVNEFDIPVDYNSTFNIDTYLASEDRSAQHGMTAALYTKANNELVALHNITENKTGDREVHVRFTKNTDTVYYQIHFREHQDSTYNTVDEVVAYLNANDYVLNSYPATDKMMVTADNAAAVNALIANNNNLDCYIEVMTGTTGASVTCVAVADTSVSDGYNVGESSASAQISGHGTTIVTKQYSLKTYKLGFDPNSGTMAAGFPQYDVKRNALIDTDILPENNSGYKPTKTGYTLLGWNTDKTATEPLDLAVFKMPASNTTLFAVWGPVQYYVIFDYTSYTKVGDTQTKLTDLADEYFQDLSVQDRADNTSEPYGTLNGFAPVINSLQLTETPKYPGLAFKRWIYYVGGVATPINSLTVSALAKADLNETNQAVYIYAEWETAQYKVTFNSNGTILQTRLDVTNFTKYTDYTYPAATTRTGYTFCGWYTAENKGGNFVMTGQGYTAANGVTSIEDVALLGNTTLYAGWNANAYTLDVSGVSENINLEVLVNGVLWNGTDSVVTGDILTITPTARPGYAADDLYVCNVVCSSGTYTVLHSYTDNKITLACDTITNIYTITYKLNGGAWVDNTYTAPLTFTIVNAENPAASDIISMPNKSKVARTGYTFGGWFMTDSTGAFVGSAKESVHDFFNPISNIANVQLTAKWTPEQKEIIVHKNFESITLPWNNLNTTAGTGEVVELAIPVPDSYKLVGLATTASGKVEYHAYEKDETFEEGETKYMYVKYTVKTGVNELYCKWIGSGNLGVLITASEENYVYSPTKTLTLTATSTKLYSDNLVESREFAFTWKKYNGLRFVTISTQTSSEPQTTLTLKNCSDSGLYRCELIVTVVSRNESDDDYDQIVEYAANTPEDLGVDIPVGDFDENVTIAQAKISSLLLASDSLTYNATDLKDSIRVQYGLSLGGLNQDATELTLPDNSVALIEYSYYDKTSGEHVSEIKNVGEYTVKADFIMDENGNYQLIEPLSATLIVTPKKITNISYGLAGYEAGTLSVDYTGSPVTLVATSSDIFASDANNVTIVLTNASGNVKVGDYTAIVDKLEGSASGNYELNLVVTKRTCKYYITASKREIDVDFVGINANRVVEVTYDGNVHTISIGELPDEVKDQVTVSYSVKYTPAYAGYTAPANNIVETQNGGKSAGTYVVTASFIEATGNHAAKDDITATLVIKQATYSIDATKVDPETGDSFRNNQYVSEDDRVHKPVVVGLNTAEVVATYKYEKDNRVPGAAQALWEDIGSDVGFSEAGQYRLTARFTYQTGFLNNNYAAINDIVINYVIVKANLATLKVVYADETKKLVGTYGGTLDTDQFSVYAVFGTGDDVHEELIYNSALTFIDKTTGEALDKFNSVNSKYPIKIKFYSQEVDCTVNVSAATYDINVSFEDATKVYNKEGNEPELTVNYVKDVNGKNVTGVSFFYSVFNETTHAWGAYVPVGELKFYDVGTYKVKLAYMHNDPNYVGTDYTDLEGEVIVTIAAKPVTEVTWQYSADNGITWDNLPAGGLTYTGSAYKFLALYDGATENAVATVAQTATNVKEGGYVITAVSNDPNYALGTDNTGLTTTVIINPYEIEASWFIDGNAFDPTEKQLIYDISEVDQFGKITATYVNLNNQTVSLQVNKELNPNGDEIDVISVRDYTLTVSEPTDTNYKVSAATKTQIITLNGLDLDESLVWYEYSTNGSTWTKVPDNGELPYAGKTYTFRVCYYQTEEDMQEALLKGEDMNKIGSLSASIINCGECKLAAGNVDSFYISNTVTVKVKPLTLTITLTNPEFDGSEKAPQFNLNGVVDGLTANDLLTINGDVKARNVKVDGNYVMNVALNGSDASKNYVLATASQSLAWNITPKKAVFNWTNLEIGYTGSAVRPDVTLVKAEYDTDELVLVVVGSSIVVSDGNPVSVERIENADGSENHNYALKYLNEQGKEVSVESRETYFDIKKASISVENVQYNEYSTKNQTFKGTNLRNDKLSGEAYVTVNGKKTPINGKLRFVSTNAYDTVGFYYVPYTFTPTDIDHYEVYQGTLYMMVKNKAVSGLEIDSSAAMTTFVKSTSVFRSNLSTGLKFYKVYNDYYYDALKGEYYGTREEISAADAASAEYSINEKEITDTAKYTFTNAGVKTVTVMLNGREATYEITVTDYAVEKITLNNNTKTTYYVTEMFDVSTITLNVKYEGESNARVINSGISVKGNYATDAFTTAGTTAVTLEYGGKEFVLNVEVLSREELNIVYTGRDLKYTGEVISMPTATLNGKELLHNTYLDIDGDGTNDVIAVYSIYSFTPADKGLSPFATTAYSMLEEGSYDIKVTINVVNIKYNDHDAIVSTFNVVDSAIEKVYQLKLIESSSLQLTEYNNAFFLTKVVGGATVEGILGNFEATEGKIVVTNNKGKTVQGSTAVGTDFVITLVDENDQPVAGVEKVTIVLRGDVNSDAKITVTDYSFLKAYLVGKKTLTDAQILAGDIDGKNGVKVTDYSRLKAYLVGKSTMTW